MLIPRSATVLYMSRDEEIVLIDRGSNQADIEFGDRILTGVGQVLCELCDWGHGSRPSECADVNSPAICAGIFRAEAIFNERDMSGVFHDSKPRSLKYQKPRSLWNRNFWGV